MKENYKMFIKPDGEKIPLYAEVGRFFSPDGSFDEFHFCKNLREYLEILTEKHGGNQKDLDNKINKWFSLYLNDILIYLDEKDMNQASFNLFQAAIDEYNKLGVKAIFVSPGVLKNFFIIMAVEENKPEKKKNLLSDKRKKIFDAALLVFSKEGYYKATIDMVASQSGVGKGSIYRYFKSKEDLLTQLLDEKYDEIVMNFNTIFSKEKDVIRQIQGMIEFWVSFIEVNHELYRLIQSEAIAQINGNRKMFYDYIISHLPMLKESIVALNFEKKIKTTNFYSVFYGILGFIDGIVYKWNRNGRNYSLRDEVPVILEVLFNGFIGENFTKKKYFIPPERETSKV